MKHALKDKKVLVVSKNIAIKQEVLKNKFGDWSGGLSCLAVQLYCYIPIIHKTLLVISAYNLLSHK